MISKTPSSFIVFCILYHSINFYEWKEKLTKILIILFCKKISRVIGFIRVITIYAILVSNQIKTIFYFSTRNWEIKQEKFVLLKR